VNAAWVRRIDGRRETDEYSEGDESFSLFMGVRTKIKILKIVSLHVASGGVFSFNPLKPELNSSAQPA
jgi:hypothetical protein